LAGERVSEDPVARQLRFTQSNANAAILTFVAARNVQVQTGGEGHPFRAAFIGRPPIRYVVAGDNAPPGVDLEGPDQREHSQPTHPLAFDATVAAIIRRRSAA
jgi:hypothetical protein